MFQAMDRHLASLGVVKAFGNTKLAHDQGRLFRAMGWREAERLFVKTPGHMIWAQDHSSGPASLVSRRSSGHRSRRLRRSQAAKAQIYSAQLAADTQNNMFNKTQANLAPYITLGSGRRAAQTLGALIGRFRL
jgi:hypothetical protein